MQLLGLYMALIYGIFYRTSFPVVNTEKILTSCSVFLTTMPGIFSQIYHMEIGIAGLNYIALGIGLTGASQVNAFAYYYDGN